jgi:hypothetical protein
MNRFRHVVAIGAVALLGGLTPARGADEVLVPGNPPLTQRTMDQALDFLQWLFDYTFTDEQRRDYQDLAIEGWRMNASNRSNLEARIQFLNYWDKRHRELTPFYTNFWRFRLRAANIPVWEKSPEPGNRWLVKLYRSLQEPGGPGNAVLVDADPPLTEQVARRYADYLEFALDFSVTGELTAAQRRIHRDYLIRDWKRWDKETRRQLLSTLENYQQKASMSNKDVTDWRLAEQARALARLRTTRDDERTQWLLEIVDQERQKQRLVSDLERQRHETAMSIIRNMRPSGHYEYRYGRRVWVNDR